MTTPTTERPSSSFEHLALLYDGLDDFVSGTDAFISRGLERDDDVLIITERPRLDAIRDLHGTGGGTITYVDSREAGPNPSSYLPVWATFLTRAHAAGRGVSGIGEPLWVGRSAAEAAEVRVNERIANTMHLGAAEVSLMCSYAVDVLDPAMLDDVVRNHQVIRSGGSFAASERYEPGDVDDVLAEPLPAAPVHATQHSFGPGDHAWVRDLVDRTCRDAGLDPDRSEDLVLAVHELAANCVQHGGGSGVLRSWAEEAALVFELTSGGRFDDPLVGRRQPGLAGERGRGVWLANQLCDLVQLRNTPSGNVARAHVRLSR